MRPSSTGSRFGQQGKLSVSEMIALRERGGPSMSNVSDADGNVLSQSQAFARMPSGGYQIGGGSVSGGRGRGYGGYAQPPRQPVGTLGVGGGIPTSQSGRMRLAMQSNPYLAPDQAWAGAEKPAYQQASDDFRRDAMKPRYGTMLPTGGGSGGSGFRSSIAGFANGTRDSGPKPQVAVVGERGPEVMVVPANSAIIPSLADSGFGPTAFDEMTGGASMEPRMDAEGNVWRYDQEQGRGIPENPYILGNENAPSPNSFRMTPQQRYQDLSMRLDALRKEGVAQGRAAVSRLLGTQAEERDATKAFLASGKPITEAGGGGTLYKTPYGNAILGGNRAKSFTVENWEGGRTSSPSLAEASRESRADAAERTVRGLGLDRYKAMPNPTPATVQPPSALDEIMEEEAPVMVPEVLASAPPKSEGSLPTGERDIRAIKEVAPDASMQDVAAGAMVAAAMGISAQSYSDLLRQGLALGKDGKFVKISKKEAEDIQRKLDERPRSESRPWEGGRPNG
jgi:hypothetical protein